MKKKILLLTIFIWLVCIILSLIPRDSLTTSIDCKEKKIMEDYEFYGIVSNKYEDYENHGTKTLLIKNFEKNNYWKLYLIREKSDFYEVVNIGDTIRKIKQSIVIKDYTNKKEHQLLYDCLK